MLTDRGQALILQLLEGLGGRTGAGPWGFLQTFGAQGPMDAVPLKRQVALAESYIVEAQRQTLVAARATLWVLIAGCAACALAATAIIGVLPPFVMSGAWTYEAYQQAALIVVIGTAAGGVAVGVGLTVWLSRVVLRMNCNETCSAAHSVVAAVQSSGISAELAHELATGAYPRLGRLIAHVRH